MLASLVAGRILQRGVLSATLGLPEGEFQTLWHSYFPGLRRQLPDGPTIDLGELSEVSALLLNHRAGRDASQAWLTHIVAYACCGRDHLWQDLRLSNRDELSQLMTLAFPGLAALNIGDMKWKKFIFRHYCSTENIYVCPAPSCSECSDYRHCFAPEV